MSNSNGLQLLPENRKSISIKVPGENIPIYIGSFLVALVFLIAGGLSIYSNGLKNKIAAKDGEILVLENRRDKQAEQKLIILSKQLGVTSQILKNHIYWSVGFSKIESAMQSQIQFKSFSANLAEKTVNFQALSDSYTTVAKQLAAFISDDAIKDVTLNNVNILTSGKLDFNAKIDFNELKFIKK